MHTNTSFWVTLFLDFVLSSSWFLQFSFPYSSYFPHLLFLLLLTLLLGIEIFFPPVSTFLLPLLLLLISAPRPLHSPCLSSSPVYLFSVFCISLNLCSSAFKIIVFCLSSPTFLPLLHIYLFLSSSFVFLFLQLRQFHSSPSFENTFKKTKYRIRQLRAN